MLINLKGSLLGENDVFCVKEKTRSWQCELEKALVACVLRYYLLVKEGKKCRQSLFSDTCKSEKATLADCLERGLEENIVTQKHLTASSFKTTEISILSWVIALSISILLCQDIDRYARVTMGPLLNCTSFPPIDDPLRLINNQSTRSPKSGDSRTKRVTVVHQTFFKHAFGAYQEKRVWLARLESIPSTHYIII